MTRRSPASAFRTVLPVAWTLSIAILTGPGASAQEERGYGHIRTLEGSATLIRADTGAREELLVNYPLQVGDSLETAADAAVELVLADFNVLRIGGGSDVAFPELANSADSQDPATVLVLDRGELQLLVTEHALGEELPAIETPEATLYLHEPGRYVVSVDELRRTRVVVRDGYAEVATSAGSRTLETGQELYVDGGAAAAAVVAGPPSDLERWGDALSASAISAPEEVSPELGYSASVLEESGEWVETEGRRAWRPHVGGGWRPYANGFWVSTPSGLTWVGSSRWSWVTSHYGRWVPHPAWGWVWHPGYRYFPARVYWYWGPGWVGWVPSGYYGSHAGFGNFYGYTGGPWSYYRDWTFCPTAYFGTRGGSRHHYPGYEMPERSGRPAVPRGVLATETRGIRRVEWRDGSAVARELLTRGDGEGQRRDLTDFVAGRTGRPRAPGADGGAAEWAVPRPAVPRSAVPRSVFDSRADEGRRSDPAATPSREIRAWQSPESHGAVARRPDQRPESSESPVRRVIERLRARQAEREARERQPSDAEVRSSSGERSRTTRREIVGRRDGSRRQVRSGSGQPRGRDTSTRARPSRGRSDSGGARARSTRRSKARDRGNG